MGASVGIAIMSTHLQNYCFFGSISFTAVVLIAYSKLSVIEVNNTGMTDR